ncbi:hypothetical protein FQR65_LT16189 [Abscondita terminalis]|nr:hypothetical protein FQR65_LT16189 [Abscondita terminalis]
MASTKTRKATRQQMVAFLAAIENNTIIRYGKGDVATKKQAWDDIALHLNSLGGAFKTADQWKQEENINTDESQQQSGKPAKPITIKTRKLKQVKSKQTPKRKPALLEDVDNPDWGPCLLMGYDSGPHLKKILNESNVLIHGIKNRNYKVLLLQRYDY